MIMNETGRGCVLYGNEAQWRSVMETGSAITNVQRYLNGLVFIIVEW